MAKHLHGAVWDLVHHNLGQPVQAIASYQRAVGWFHELGNRYYEASSLNRLGDTLEATDDQAGASAAWQRAPDTLASWTTPTRTGFAPGSARGWLGHRRAVTGQTCPWGYRAGGGT